MPVTGEKFELVGPGGPRDMIANRILSSHSFGTKLFLVVSNTPTAELYVFDLKRFLGESAEPSVTADEFYALREEVRDVHKAIARQALGSGDDGKRGPGRPSNAERAALAGARS